MLQLFYFVTNLYLPVARHVGSTAVTHLTLTTQNNIVWLLVDV